MKCWTTSATSPRPAADSVGLRAGFTIIELLIVIGVVLVIGAISLPFTLRQFERRTETEAIDRLGLLLRLARAESRSSGVPLEVRCDAAGRKVFVLRVDPRDPPTIEIGGSELDEGDDPERQLLDSWSIVELPSSLTVVPAPEKDDDDGFFGDDLDLDFEPLSVLDEDPLSREDPWSATTRLVLLVPDGTVISTEDFGLRSPEGWRRLRVDPWTAVATLESPPDRDSADTDDPLGEAESDPESESDSMVDEDPILEPDTGGVP